MEGIRAFVCLDISEEVKKKIGETIEQVRSGKIRPVSPEHLHITLFFFEKINEEQVALVIKAINEVNAARFEVAVEGVGTFNLKRPNVIFAKVKEGAKIIDIYKKLFPSLKRVGFENEDRPFSPHITIARVKDPDRETIERIADFVELNKNTYLGTFKCSNIILKHSTLTNEGPVYKTLFSKELD